MAITGLEEQYLENIGEIPEVEDIVKFNGRGKECCSDFLMQGYYRKEKHRFLGALNGLRKCRAYGIVSKADGL